MGKYSIVNRSTVKFGKYQDVLRVIGRIEKNKGFFASLFSSSHTDTHFILSKESPLAKQIQGNNIWDVDESMFRPTTLNGMTYLIEVNFYSGGGSKLNDVVRSQADVAPKVNGVFGFEFV